MLVDCHLHFIIIIFSSQTLFYFKILDSVDKLAEMWYTIQVGTRGADDNIAGWSSSVARRAHNPKVVSSNLAPATRNSYF